MFYDALIRFGALASLVAVAGFILSARPPAAWRWPLRIAAAHCLSLTGPMILGAPDPVSAPALVEDMARLIAAPNTALLWLLGLAVFRDRFVPRAWHLAVVIAVTSLSITVRFPELYAILPLRDLRADAMGWLSVLMALHVGFVLLSEGRDDLVEGRRRARIFIVVTLMVGGLISLATESLLPAAAKNTFQAAIGLLFAALLGGWLLRLDPKRLAFDEPRRRAPAPDSALAGRLIALMVGERPYLEPGLTIGALANRLGVPAHQLRVVINNGAGFRNFSAFVNSYRVAEAKRRLGDPEEAALPILTIALDSGFGSIAAFNRTFSAQEGQTPGTYRRAALARARP